eukprot:317502-Pelagomonas_calceolata.AAC.5
MARSRLWPPPKGSYPQQSMAHKSFHPHRTRRESWHTRPHDKNHPPCIAGVVTGSANKAGSLVGGTGLVDHARMDLRQQRDGHLQAHTHTRNNEGVDTQNKYD